MIAMGNIDNHFTHLFSFWGNANSTPVVAKWGGQMYQNPIEIIFFFLLVIFIILMNLSNNLGHNNQRLGLLWSLHCLFSHYDHCIRLYCTFLLYQFGRQKHLQKACYLQCLYYLQYANSICQSKPLVHTSGQIHRRPTVGSLHSLHFLQIVSVSNLYHHILKQSH